MATSKSANPRPIAAQVAVIVTIAWGVFAFGAAYPWASWPMMVGCLVSSLLVWMSTRGRLPWPFVLACALVAAAIALQLIPVSPRLMATISPGTPTVVSTIDPAYGSHPGPHPLSIAPHATAHALALFVSMAIFTVSLAQLLAATGTRWLLVSVSTLGVVLALIGLAQKAADTDLVYGFWAPEQSGAVFGPFVNRNHFAGWMLMALPLVLALLCGAIARGMQIVRPTLRDRFLWLGSPAAGEVLLTGTAAAAMGIALVMTMSRSGMSAFTLAVAITGLFVARGIRARTGKSIAGVYLAGLLVLVAMWVGVDVIAARFAESDWGEFNGRLGAWTDARDIGRRFLAAGTGLNTYGVATVFFQRHELDVHFDQAHNDYLQLFAEGGLLLVIPAAIFAVTVMTGIWRRFGEDERQSAAWWARAGAVTGLVSMGLQETVEFSLQMPGNALLFSALCAVALHKPPARHGSHTPRAGRAPVS